MSVTLPRTILRIIQTQAERKGMTDQMLVASLLGKIVEDNLFAVVLDRPPQLAASAPHNRRSKSKPVARWMVESPAGRIRGNIARLGPRQQGCPNGAGVSSH
jgi:hypothetical protein